MKTKTNISLACLCALS